MSPKIHYSHHYDNLGVIECPTQLGEPKSSSCNQTCVSKRFMQMFFCNDETSRVADPVDQPRQLALLLLKRSPY